jgi:hypothetical protein
VAVNVACVDCGKPCAAAIAICGLCLRCLLKHEEKVKCSKCGRLVKAKSSAKRKGCCLRCGAKRDEFFGLYSSLIGKVCRSPGGFEGLSDPEKLYFALTLFQYEVNDNGFLGFLFSSSCSYYEVIEDGLARLDEPQTITLLAQAGRMVFQETAVPADEQKRRSIMPDLTLDLVSRLNDIDEQFYRNSDSLSSKLQAFSREHRLVRQEQ